MNEHEQINDKCVALSTKSAKMTTKVLAKLMLAYINKVKNPSEKHGKQSLKSLSESGASLSDVEISNDNIGSFKKIARKYNIDFALKRDDSCNPPKWIAFFKAKQDKAMELAFKEFTHNLFKKKIINKTLADKLIDKNEIAKSTPHKVLEWVKDIAGMAR